MSVAELRSHFGCYNQLVMVQSVKNIKEYQIVLTNSLMSNSNNTTSCLFHHIH